MRWDPRTHLNIIFFGLRLSFYIRNRTPTTPSSATAKTRINETTRLIIPVVGPITALTWALEVGDVQRFSSIKKAISYCGFKHLRLGARW